MTPDFPRLTGGAGGALVAPPGAPISRLRGGGCLFS